MNSLRLYNWCVAILKDNREDGTIPDDVTDEIIDREAQKLESELRKYTSSFVDNEMDLIA